MDLKQLFTWYFWAEKSVPMQDRTIMVLIIFFACLVVLGIVLAMLAKKKQVTGLAKAQMRAFVKPLIVGGLAEILYAWVHFEGVPFFSKRIWFLFIFLGLILWIAHRARLAYRVYPTKYTDTEPTRVSEKYLPKRIKA